MNKTPLSKAERSATTIFVAGGAGYLGSVLTSQLLARGYSVRVFDRLLFGAEGLKEHGDNPRLTVVRGDVRELASILAALQGVDAVLLLAALAGEKACNRDPLETLGVNYLAPIAIAEACRQMGIVRLIFTSTDSAYGIQEGIVTEESSFNPISLYARLKGEAEKKMLPLASETFAPCVLRLATIYGLSPRMRFDLVLNQLVMDAVTKQEFTIYGGEQWRPLVHVADAARAFVTVLEAPLESVRGQVFNVGSNEQNFKIGQLADVVSKAVPGAVRKTIEASPDLRDYHVNFDKITRELGYTVRFQVIDGASEIAHALRSGRIADPTSERYRNA